MADAIFEHLAAVRRGQRWGEVLDAGTGRHSLGWVASLPTERVCAVTADPAMARSLREEFGARLRPRDRLVVGDWRDESLLGEERFDVVLADYLLGAVDGFAPYFQDRLFARLRRHVGETLFVVGLEPLAPEARGAGITLIRELAALRDACLLLAGERCYREYPVAWVERHLAASGYAVASVSRFPIRYGAGWVDRQTAMCAARAGRLSDTRLGASLRAHADALRARALAHCAAHGGIEGAEDYVVVATPG